MEEITVFVPSYAASIKLMPSSRLRKHISITTMALSTIIPIPMTRAPIVIIFRENPINFISKNVTKSDMGMELPTIRLPLKSPKKINNTSIVMTIPTRSVSAMETMESMIVSLLSYTGVILISGLAALSLSITDVTLFDSVTALELWILEILTETFSVPLYRL